MDTHWHKRLVQSIRKHSNCSHEEAFAALGEVIDHLEIAIIDAYKRGVDDGAKHERNRDRK